MHELTETHQVILNALASGATLEGPLPGENRYYLHGHHVDRKCNGTTISALVESGYIEFVMFGGNQNCAVLTDSGRSRAVT